MCVMRVVVATDRIGDLDSAGVGSALAAGWQRTAPWAELAVVPMGESARGFGGAAAALLGVEAMLLAAEGGAVVAADRATLVISVEQQVDHRAWVPLGSSVELGRMVAEQVREHRPRHLVIDVGGVAAQDGGAGFLHGLGARADAPLDEGVTGLRGITDVDLSPVHHLLAGVDDITVIVPDAEAEIPLLGLRGTTSLRGSAARQEPGSVLENQDMLDADAALEAFAAAVDPEAAGRPGAGACGVAFALLALGADVGGGPRWCGDRAGIERTLAHADVVLTGTDLFDFASRGGGVVQHMAHLSEVALRPCIAAAGAVVIGARVMRSLGIESADAVDELAGERQPMVGADDLVELGARIARTWDR